MDKTQQNVKLRKQNYVYEVLVDYDATDARY